MSRLADELTAVLLALEAGGVRTATSGKLTAPVVLVEPGDPWSAHVRMGQTMHREDRWRLTAIAGAVDTMGSLEELAELVDRIDAALRTLQGAQLPTWARPTLAVIADGVTRPATIGTIQYSST